MRAHAEPTQGSWAAPLPSFCLFDFLSAFWAHAAAVTHPQLLCTSMHLQQCGNSVGEALPAQQNFSPCELISRTEIHAHALSGRRFGDWGRGIEVFLSNHSFLFFTLSRQLVMSSPCFLVSEHPSFLLSRALFSLSQGILHSPSHSRAMPAKKAKSGKTAGKKKGSKHGKKSRGFAVYIFRIIRQVSGGKMGVSSRGMGYVERQSSECVERNSV